VSSDSAELSSGSLVELFLVSFCLLLGEIVLAQFFLLSPLVGRYFSLVCLSIQIFLCSGVSGGEYCCSLFCFVFSFMIFNVFDEVSSSSEELSSVLGRKQVSSCSSRLFLMSIFLNFLLEGSSSSISESYSDSELLLL